MTPPPVVVLTPRHAGLAQRVGDRTWRKLVLPTGSVQHGGKALHFTADYVRELAGSFRQRAYDYVPLQLGTGLDPEDYAGRITDVEAGPDGLYAMITTTERGDRALAADPCLPLSARITESYQRSDGQFFGAALQSVASGQAIGLSNGPQMYIDLSASHWAGEQPPDDQLTDAELTELLDAVSEADQEDEYVDIDQVVRSSLPDGYRRSLGLSNAGSEFDRVFSMVNATEQERITQHARPLPRRSEDRMAELLGRAEAGTLVPGGMYAAPYMRELGFSVQAGAINGNINCGATDQLNGLCLERYHSASCGSIADTFTAETLRPAMARLAAQPVLDADGRVHRDAATGSSMTWTDMAEWNLGERLADRSLFESGKAKRELASPARPVKLGDPDAGPDEEAWAPVSASTRRAAQRLADASRGLLRTSADVARQQVAYKDQHARLAARIGKPRHQDYAAEFSNNSAPRDTRLVPFENSVLGSLVPYASAGTVSQGDEVWLA